jgi:hypothetical protein
MSPTEVDEIHLDRARLKLQHQQDSASLLVIVWEQVMRIDSETFITHQTLFSSPQGHTPPPFQLIVCFLICEHHPHITSLHFILITHLPLIQNPINVKVSHNNNNPINVSISRYNSNASSIIATLNEEDIPSYIIGIFVAAHLLQLCSAVWNNSC